MIRRSTVDFRRQLLCSFIMQLVGIILFCFYEALAFSPSVPLGAQKRSFIASKQRQKTSLFSSIAPPLPPAIQVDGLTCSHDGGTTYQLNDVSYVLPRGGKIGLVGRNGCGVSFICDGHASLQRSIQVFPKLPQLLYRYILHFFSHSSLIYSQNFDKIVETNEKEINISENISRTVLLIVGKWGGWIEQR